MKKAVFNWSGGKDSALALYKVIQEKQYDIVALLTAVNSQTNRSSMHAIPTSLLEAQAESIGIPLYVVNLDAGSDMKGYEDAMRQATMHFKDQGIEHFIFGDIFLHDVRSYREKQLSPMGVTVVEPLWDKTSREVIEEFLASGLKTVIVTTMADLLDESYIGRIIDREMINNLPSNIDPCGENGEYHTFCYGGELFAKEVEFKTGKPFYHSNNVKMENGSMQVFNYWFSNLQSPK